MRNPLVGLSVALMVSGCSLMPKEQKLITVWKGNPSYLSQSRQEHCKLSKANTEEYIKQGWKIKDAFYYSYPSNVIGERMLPYTCYVADVLLEK